MNNDLYCLSIRLNSLSVFRALLSDPVVKGLTDYLSAATHGTDDADTVYAYSEFVSKLYNSGTDDLGEYIKSLVNDDENCFIRAIGKGWCWARP